MSKRQKYLNLSTVPLANLPFTSSYTFSNIDWGGVPTITYTITQHREGFIGFPVEVELFKVTETVAWTTTGPHVEIGDTFTQDRFAVSDNVGGVQGITINWISRFKPDIEPITTASFEINFVPGTGGTPAGQSDCRVSVLWVPARP